MTDPIVYLDSEHLSVGPGGQVVRQDVAVAEFVDNVEARQSRTLWLENLIYFIFGAISLLIAIDRQNQIAKQGFAQGPGRCLTFDEPDQSAVGPYPKLAQAVFVNHRGDFVGQYLFQSVTQAFPVSQTNQTIGRTEPEPAPPIRADGFQHVRQ